jgi:hypothetical protein
MVVVKRTTTDDLPTFQIIRAERRAKLLRDSGDERRAIQAEIEAFEIEAKMKFRQGLLGESIALQKRARELGIRLSWVGVA